ncbi:MAG TPA: EamA family transporter, partial [Solirubrobacterales bacterium]|nr:EamA family transporter [Solirubrobacterales bacterium]
DGGIAAVLSIAAGSSAVSVVSALCLAAMVVGVVLAVASGQESSPKGRIKLDSRTVLAAVLSAVTYGIVFFAASEVTALQPAWVTAFARAISLLPIAFLLLRAGGMTMPKPRTWRWIVATGVADALGFTAYIAAAEGDVPVAAVTTAQYAAIGVVGGVVFFGESLSWTQRAGIAMLLVSVSLLALAS